MYKDEAEICRKFVEAFSALISYGQVNNPDELMWYHIPLGQKAAGYFVAEQICTFFGRKDHAAINFVKKKLATFAAIMGKRDRDLGARKGTPDLYFSFRNEEGDFVIGYIEVKVPGGKVQPEQVEFREYCVRVGLHHSYETDPWDIIKRLQEWGLVKSTAVI